MIPKDSFSGFLDFLVFRILNTGLSGYWFFPEIIQSRIQTYTNVQIPSSGILLVLLLRELPLCS